MLIDKYAPVFDFNEVHTIKIDSSTKDVMKGIKELKSCEIHKIMNLLLEIRSIPYKLKGKKAKNFDKKIPMLEGMYQNKFFLLEENLNELVIGMIGKFWQLNKSAEIEIKSKEHFLNFDDPEYGVITFNMLFTGGKLRTETRIQVKDETSKRKFRLYWIAIRWGSGLIRRVWLKAIKNKVENNLT